jgi:hypothetical protein
MYLKRNFLYAKGTQGMNILITFIGAGPSGAVRRAEFQDFQFFGLSTTEET